MIGKEIFGRDIDQTIRLLEAAEKESFPLSPAHMALGGADLEALGLHGKQIGDALQKLFTMVLADPSRNTKEDLLKEAKNLIYFSHR